MEHQETAQSRKTTELKALNKQELRDFCQQQDLKRFRSDQIFQWLYQKGVSGFDEMTNLSKELRNQLSEIATISRIRPASQQSSSDGTIKFLFRLHDGHQIESVLIPDFDEQGHADRLTVCVSSQVGCAFGCSFCATGKMGWHRNLLAGEIVDQAQYINEVAEQTYGKGITNIVYMGMGEPLHNYKAVVNSANIISDELSIGLSPKRITISTVGLPHRIKQLGDTRQPFNLAISLHAANDDKRDQIMPINDTSNLSKLRESVEHYYQAMMKPLTYEYLLFDEFNDGPEDARELAAIARWVPSKINIIMYNDVAGVALKRAREERLDRFMKALVDEGVRATVRRSRGDDIDAGCGQLAVQENTKKGKSIGSI